MDARVVDAQGMDARGTDGCGTDMVTAKARGSRHGLSNRGVAHALA
jgi:hypothetical protein